MFQIIFRVIIAAVLTLFYFLRKRFTKVEHFVDSEGRAGQRVHTRYVIVIALAVVPLVVFLGFIVDFEADPMIAMLIGAIVGGAIILALLAVVDKVLGYSEGFYAEDSHSFVLRLNKKKCYTVFYDNIISYKFVGNSLGIDIGQGQVVAIPLNKYRPICLLQALRDMEEEGWFREGHYERIWALQSLDSAIEAQKKLLDEEKSK